MKRSNKSGFTLAEVLITLGIIGVVAALTLPALIVSYQKHVTINKLKKIYSTLSNATEQIINDNGDIYTWNLKDGDINSIKTIGDEYSKYFVTIKTCVNTGGCWAFPDYSSITKTVHQQTHSSDAFDYSFCLSDGSNILIDIISNGNIIIIRVDINGFQKPNIIGKDMFYMTVNNDKIMGYGSHLNCSKDSGFSCFSKILNDGWEIKNDYPW